MYMLVQGNFLHGGNGKVLRVEHLDSCINAAIKSKAERINSTLEHSVLRFTVCALTEKIAGACMFQPRKIAS